MILHALASEVSLLMLVATAVGRLVFPLEAYVRSGSTRARGWVITLAMSMPLWHSLLSSAEAAGDCAFVPSLVVVTLCCIWILSILPSANLCSKHRLQIPMLPPGRMKSVIGFLMMITLYNSAGFSILFAFVYFYNKDKYRFVSQTELLMPHGLSVVMVGYICVSMFTPISEEALRIGLVSTAGAHYFRSGFMKLCTGWAWRNRLGNIVIAAKSQNGWAMMSNHRAGRKLAFPLSFVSQPVVVLLEVLAVWSFLDQQIAFIIFPLLIAMHIGILVTTGIFFWKWIAALVCLLIVEWSVGPIHLHELDLFSTTILILSAVGFPFVLSRMATLAWFDTPVSRQVDFVIRAQNGEAVINPYDLDPLDVLFSQARHEFYFDQALNSLECMGTSRNSDLAKTLNRISSSTELSLEEKQSQALDLLGSLESTSLQHAAMMRESVMLIDQLCYNLRKSSKPWILNSHIRNGRSRSDPARLRSILSDPNAKLIVQRRVYIYCRSSDQSILLDEQAIEILLKRDRTMAWMQ